MMTMNGKIVHPLRRSGVLLGEQKIFDRSDNTGIAWFVIDLALGAGGFAPKGSSGLQTADGLSMQYHSRRK